MLPVAHRKFSWASSKNRVHYLQRYHPELPLPYKIIFNLGLYVQINPMEVKTNTGTCT